MCPPSNYELHRMATSRNEGYSVIALIVNKMPARIAQCAGGEVARSAA